MLTTLLLAATQFPILSALAKEIWAGALVLSSVLIFLVKHFIDKRKAAEDKAVAEKKEAVDKHAKEVADYEARIKKVEEECHNNSLKHTSAHLERERLVDQFTRRFEQVESKVSQVDSIASELNIVKSELKVQGTTIANMNANITEMKSDSKSQFAEIIGILKTGVYNK